MIKRYRRFAYWFVMIALIVGIGTNVVRRVRAQSHSTATTVLTEVVTRANGEIHGSLTYVYAVRADGSQTMIASAPVSHPNFENRLIDLASGEHIAVQDTRRLKSTLPPSLSFAGRPRRDPNSNCAVNGEPLLGLQNIGPFRSMGIGRAGHKAWYALDYGCALVGERFEFSDGAVSEKRLVTLFPGEPDPSLFMVPLSYTEVVPSVLGVEPGDTPSAPMLVWDEEYRKRHTQSAAH